jgi:hypothetical protein
LFIVYQISGHDLGAWGSAHPDKRVCVEGSNIRVKWTSQEKDWIEKWLGENWDSPVRCLYNAIHCDKFARSIFHAHHVDIDKVDYMFKQLKNN